MYLVFKNKYKTMTKEGYTHVLIPISLHSVLKENAKISKTSIWRYIEELLEGNTKRPKVQDLRSCCAGIRGFKSHPPHTDFIHSLNEYL